MAQTIIALDVTPKSSRNEIIGWVAGADGALALKIRLNATPEDGKANAALIKFLSKEWGVPAATLALAGGATSRHKRLDLGSDALYQRVISSYRKD